MLTPARPLVYVIGSLRNPKIPEIARTLEAATDFDVFASWFAAGPEADDHWKAYEQAMGHDYVAALRQPAAVHVYGFDRKFLERASAVVLVLPAGKSGHMELGWSIGRGVPGFILLDGEDVRWDVMYQFANGVSSSVGEVADWVKTSVADKAEL